jgi:predicted nucleic acid-binding protein
MSILFSRMSLVEETVFRNGIEQASEIMDIIDPNDTPFIALALALKNDGIWTGDKHIGKQGAVRIWTTIDLLRRMKANS